MGARRQNKKKRFPVTVASLLLAAMMNASASLAFQDPTDGAVSESTASPLIPGAIRERTLAAGATARYSIAVRPDEIALVEIDQGGLDLQVAHLTADGRRLVFNSLLLRDEREIVLIEGAAAGRHVLELWSDEFTDTLARTRVRAIYLATDRDARTIAGYRAMMRGNALAQSASEEDWRQARTSYLEAADVWRGLDDDHNLAWALYSIAALDYWKRTHWRDAAMAAEAAASAYLGSGDRLHYTGARHLQAAALLEAATENRPEESGRSDEEVFSEVEALFGEVLAMQEQGGQPFRYALTVNNLGLSAFYQGRFGKARDHWSRAAQLFGAQGEWEYELNSLANIGVLSFEAGDLRQAVEIFTRVVDSMPDGKLAMRRADILDNRAQALFALMRYEDALSDFNEALKIHARLGSIKGQGRSLNGIANVYYALGDLERAQEYFERALRYRTRAQDGRGQVSASRMLGDVERQLGNLQRAEELHRLSSSLARSPRERANAGIALARDLLAANRAAESVAPLDESLALAAGAGLDRVLASALLERGHAWLELGRFERAARDLDQALAVYERLGLSDGEASALYLLARLATVEARWVAALELARASIDRIETLRGHVPFPELRATYLSQRRAPYELYVDVLMRLADMAPDRLRHGFVADALTAAELARSRRLVDLINEAALDVARGSDPVLIERRQVLYQRLGEARYRLDQALETDRGDRHAGETDPRDALNGIETEIQLLEAELRRTNDRYAALTEPVTLDAEEMMSLLGPEELLIQFSLGEERSFVWFVDRHGITGRTLPARVDIDTEARVIYEQLRIYQHDRSARMERDRRIDALATMLLDAGVDLGRYRRLLIAADGVLQLVPFSVLPVLQADGERRALVHSHEVVGVPSMSALALNRHPAAKDSDPSQLIAVFADPVFTVDKTPASSGAGSMAAAVSGSIRAEGPTAAGDWQRLPYTKLEASLITELAPPDRTFVATGTAASRAAVLNSELERYRYLHFATHGRIDTRYPALSALALSRVDVSGEQTDGLLRLSDISRLTLNADMVVLSACDTARGREIRGESMLGFTQAFFAAGTDQVLASLWAVPDRGTARLMEAVYRGLLQEGLEPAAALRNAQLHIAAQRRWADPFYWGAFVLQRGR